MATEAQSDSAGLFDMPNLVPGGYELSVAAEGLSPTVAKVSLAAGAAQTMNLALAVVQPQPQTPQSNLPHAPSSSKTAPSLWDLAFPPEQTQGSAREQALLDKRTRMLKIHQRLGPITAAPGRHGRHLTRCRRPQHQQYRSNRAHGAGRRHL